MESIIARKRKRRQEDQEEAPEGPTFKKRCLSLVSALTTGTRTALQQYRESMRDEPSRLGQADGSESLPTDADAGHHDNSQQGNQAVSSEATVEQQQQQQQRREDAGEPTEPTASTLSLRSGGGYVRGPPHGGIRVLNRSTASHLRKAWEDNKILAEALRDSEAACRYANNTRIKYQDAWADAQQKLDDKEAETCRKAACDKIFKKLEAELKQERSQKSLLREDLDEQTKLKIESDNALEACQEQLSKAQTSYGSMHQMAVGEICERDRYKKLYESLLAAKNSNDQTLENEKAESWQKAQEWCTGRENWYNAVFEKAKSDLKTSHEQELAEKNREMEGLRRQLEAEKADKQKNVAAALDSRTSEMKAKHAEEINNKESQIQKLQSQIEHNQNSKSHPSTAPVEQAREELAAKHADEIKKKEREHHEALTEAITMYRDDSNKKDEKFKAWYNNAKRTFGEQATEIAKKNCENEQLRSQLQALQDQYQHQQHERQQITFGTHASNTDQGNGQLDAASNFNFASPADLNPSSNTVPDQDNAMHDASAQDQTMSGPVNGIINSNMSALDAPAGGFSFTAPQQVQAVIDCRLSDTELDTPMSGGGDGSIINQDNGHNLEISLQQEMHSQTRQEQLAKKGEKPKQKKYDIHGEELDPKSQKGVPGDASFGEVPPDIAEAAQAAVNKAPPYRAVAQLPKPRPLYYEPGKSAHDFVKAVPEAKEELITFTPQSSSKSRFNGWGKVAPRTFHRANVQLKMEPSAPDNAITSSSVVSSTSNAVIGQANFNTSSQGLSNHSQSSSNHLNGTQVAMDSVATPNPSTRTLPGMVFTPASSATGYAMQTQLSIANTATAVESGSMGGHQFTTQSPSPVINSTTPDPAIDPELLKMDASPSGAHFQGVSSAAASSNSAPPPAQTANRAVQASQSSASFDDHDDDGQLSEHDDAEFDLADISEATANSFY